MSKSPYLSNPNILAHPDRIVQKVELDMTAQDSYLAGSPISAEGKLANDASAIGILLYDVHKAIGGRTGVVVIFGRIKQDVAAEHSGVAISDDCKAALIDVTFTGDGCRMGGGGLTELPEGYPYKEKSEGEIVVLAEETVTVSAVSMGGSVVGYMGIIKAVPNLEIGKEYIVRFNGEEYKTTAFASPTTGAASLTDNGENSYAVFCVMAGDGAIGVGTHAEGTFTISISTIGMTETIHTMAPEFLPAMVVKATVNAENTAATFAVTGAEIAAAIESGKQVVCELYTDGVSEVYRRLFVAGTSWSPNGTAVSFSCIYEYGGSFSIMAISLAANVTEGSVVFSNLTPAS